MVAASLVPLTQHGNKTRRCLSMWWFQGAIPILGDGGIDDCPTEQTPPAEDGLAHDSPLNVLHRDGHHQALAPLAHHAPASF